MLARARERQGASLADVATRTDWTFTPTVLRMIEGGGYRIPSEQVQTLLAGYEVTPDDLLPERDVLELNLTRCWMASGGVIHRFAERLSIDDILSEYLTFIRSMRAMSADAAIPPESLRHEDVAVLAHSLRLEAQAVRHRLVALLDPATSQARDAIVRRAAQQRALGRRLKEMADRA
ncbi:MAG: helix-turn-helix transcriptional regulator [Acidimicrobiales bacterium]